VAIDVEGDVSRAVEGSGFASLEDFVAALEDDAMLATQQALGMEPHKLTSLKKDGAELSVLFCDDAAISSMNKEWRGKDSSTDVLSFPGLDEQPPGYPLFVMGDVIISLDTAKSQAEERNCSLRDEVRVLLVHGIFHLLGYDHELSADEMMEMAEREVECFKRLGWQGSGLISRCEEDGLLHEGMAELSETDFVSEDSSELFMATKRGPIKLLAIDMDGTLLNSQSKITERTAAALRAALEANVRVILATGKARPAAMVALERVGLAGSGLVVSNEQPGVFLQGLAVYGSSGELLDSDSLPAGVVILLFEHAMENDISICAFLGDECVTTKMTPELEQLHYTYYEPLAKVVSSIPEVLRGPPVKKILFMADPNYVQSELATFLEEELIDSGAQLCQAVPNMLEVVPQGVNKWVGMQKLLNHMGLQPDEMMAIGDGLNDLELIQNAGFGVAMANAVPQVLGSADVVSTSNDEDGVADAIYKYLL